MLTAPEDETAAPQEYKKIYACNKLALWPPSVVGSVHLLPQAVFAPIRIMLHTAYGVRYNNRVDITSPQPQHLSTDPTPLLQPDSQTCFP